MTERATIDFGIDLGTTNSGIAYIDGAETKIIKNNDNIEITPSVVHINRKGAIIVGEGARNRQLDKHNTHSEFKRQMGTTHVYYFERIGKHMTPVELSAEVLKQLKQDVLQRKGEDLSAIVVTVPAAF
ncbi:MAG: Hsp70 family protein, partial [Candidatus Dadabacteria bacterium]|nr:Hsp70 family protein [Candidatus Dadabacteria bacterium]